MAAQEPGAGAEPLRDAAAAVPASEQATTVLPATIGPYVVMRGLGGGGMGVVSLCRTVSGRLVAVKQVREEYADDPAFRSRFRREVAAARRVSGLYTASVIDADTDGHRPWVATAYIAGPTLDQAIRICGTFQEPALRGLGTALAEALQLVHAAGLVHRDLKPGNVLLAADGPRVIDFGITKALGETRLTGTGTVIGSPAFMAPEQVVSFHDAGPESDIFTLAALLVYAACGEGPFGPGDEGALHRIVTEEPDLNGVPSALRPLLLACLDKTPSRRPTLEEILTGLAPADPEALLLPALREDLAARAREAELMAVVPPPPGTLPGGPGAGPRISRRRALIGGLSALGVLVVGGGAVAVWGDGDGDGESTVAGKNGASRKPVGQAVPSVKLTDPPKPLWTWPAPASTTMPVLDAFGSTLVMNESRIATAALDASTGKVRWKRGVSYGVPAGSKDRFGVGATILGRVGDGLLLTNYGMNSASFKLEYLMSSVDPATGRKSSTTKTDKEHLPINLMASHGQTAYCLFSRVPSGLPTPGATPSTGMPSSVGAVDLAGRTARWQQPMRDNSFNGARYAADEHGFYYCEDTGKGLTVHALNADDGKNRWSVDVPADPDSHLPPYMQAGGGQLTSALTAAGGLLITVNVKGGLTAYDAKSGRRRWSFAMTAGSTPAVAGGLVITSDLNSVYAIDLKTGKKRWQTRSPIPLGVYGSRIVSASEHVTAALFSTAVMTSDGMDMNGGTGGCMVLRTSDGKQLWSLQEKTGSGGSSAAATPAPSSSGTDAGVPTGMAFWSLTVQDRTVFIMGDGRLRAYRAAEA
ncbi:PQQ-binding-like beta-propeller repeat protein [Streptomyces sp. NPDC058221]|uniref:protein kinase domain-containing protein n=1 Tax=Streptomyces sp. NPDC058221 TaxID=3346388 RepID=UPI0036DFB610